MESDLVDFLETKQKFLRIMALHGFPGSEGKQIPLPRGSWIKLFALRPEARTRVIRKALKSQLAINLWVRSGGEDPSFPETRLFNDAYMEYLRAPYAFPTEDDGGWRFHISSQGEAIGADPVFLDVLGSFTVGWTEGTSHSIDDHWFVDSPERLDAFKQFVAMTLHTHGLSWVE